MTGDPESRSRCFDRDPWLYQRARPPYPAELYDLLTDECGLAPGCRVLEIGAGTGQATAELLARGAEVVAVEPGRGLAGLLAERLSAQPGGDRLTIVEADFEDAAVPPGPYPVVVSATAFHWVDPAVALPKIASLLPPDGTLAVWWTVFGDPDRPTAFRTALDACYARYLPHERRDRTPGPLRVGSWTDELRRGEWFGPVAVDLLRWTQRLTPQVARRLWASFPSVGELPPATRAAFLDSLARLVEDSGGVVDDPRVTVLYRARPRVLR